MLTCVFHPIEGMRVVESDEAETMEASGFWYDCPKKAKEHRERVEQEIKDEDLKKESSKLEKRHERKQNGNVKE